MGSVWEQLLANAAAHPRGVAYSAGQTALIRLSSAVLCGGFLISCLRSTKRQDKLRKAELRRPSQARNSSRDVGDHGVEQRRAHCGHANSPTLVELQETVFDQAANPLGIDQAAADLLKRPGIDAFA